MQCIISLAEYLKILSLKDIQDILATTVSQPGRYSYTFSSNGHQLAEKLCTNDLFFQNFASYNKQLLGSSGSLSAYSTDAKANLLVRHSLLEKWGDRFVYGGCQGQLVSIQISTHHIAGDIREGLKGSFSPELLQPESLRYIHWLRSAARTVIFSRKRYVRSIVLIFQPYLNISPHPYTLYLFIVRSQAVFFSENIRWTVLGPTHSQKFSAQSVQKREDISWFVADLLPNVASGTSSCENHNVWFEVIPPDQQNIPIPGSLDTWLTVIFTSIMLYMLKRIFDFL